jgi:hypothetical protein
MVTPRKEHAGVANISRNNQGRTSVKGSRFPDSPSNF